MAKGTQRAGEVSSLEMQDPGQPQRGAILTLLWFIWPDMLSRGAGGFYPETTRLPSIFSP